MRQFLIILSFLFAGILSAQEFYVKIETSNDYPGVNENFRVDYILKTKSNSVMINGGIAVNRAKSNNFTIVQERLAGMEMSFDFSDGITVKKLTQVLKPNKQGEFNLPEIEFVVEGEKYKSGKHNIHVGIEKPQTKLAEDIDNFARIKLNKSTAYVGEPITATYYMYSKFQPQDAAVNLESANQNFWTDEISSKLEVSRENINGQSYYALECKKVVLFPQKSGKLNVNKFEGQIQVLKQRRGGFIPRFETFNLTSNSPTIKVLPLPNSESNFVGNYEIYLSTSKTKTKVNEGFDVKITLKGTGNLKRINELELNFPPDFEVFDPEIKENLTLTSRGYKGEKSFNYLVIPRADGTFEIPGFELKYFNTLTKKFESKTTPDFNIEVEKGDLTQGNIQTHQSNKQNVELLDNDIHYIKSESSWISNKPFYAKWWFWLSLILPLLMLLYIFFIRNIFISKSNKTNYFKLSKEKLSTAKVALQNNNEAVFIEEILQAWQIFLCHKLNLELSQFNKQNITSGLKGNSNSEQVLSIINQLEMVKYAPIDSEGKEQLLNKSEGLINTLNDEI